MTTEPVMVVRRRRRTQERPIVVHPDEGMTAVEVLHTVSAAWDDAHEVTDGILDALAAYEVRGGVARGSYRRVREAIERSWPSLTPPEPFTGPYWVPTALPVRVIADVAWVVECSDYENHTSAHRLVRGGWICDREVVIVVAAGEAPVSTLVEDVGS